MNADFFESVPTCESPQSITQIKYFKRTQQKYRFGLNRAQILSMPHEKA